MGSAHGKDVIAVDKATQAKMAKKENDAYKAYKQAMTNDLTLESKGCIIERTEERAITIPQLDRVLNHIQRRCEAEHWLETRDFTNTLLYKKVNLYETNFYVIRPSTKDLRIAFVELIATGPQSPKWFVSHFWGEAVWDFIVCLKQHSLDRELDDTTAYWICAYANRQWDLAGEIVDDPKESSFARALKLADGTIAVIDAKAEYFTRIWCCFEIFISIIKDDDSKLRLKFDIYTCTGGEAVGVTDGFCAKDLKYGENFAMGDKSRRESDFPVDLLIAGSRFDFASANASKEKDRRHILNSVAKRNLEEVPDMKHVEYQRVDAALHGRVAQVALPLGLDQGDFKTLATKLQVSGLTAVSLVLLANVPQDLVGVALKSLPIEATKIILAVYLRDGEGFATAFSEQQRGQLRELDLVLHLSRALGGYRGSAEDYKFLRMSNVTELQSMSVVLRGDAVGNSGTSALAEAIAKQANLRKLTVNLRQQKVGSEGAVSLGSGIGQLANLNALELNLEENEVDEAGMIAFNAVIDGLPKLQKKIVSWGVAKFNITF